MPDSTDPTRGIDPTDPGAYTFWHRDVLRWGDTDGLGHINNVEFARFFESGRIALLTLAGGRLGDPLSANDFMLVHLSIDFRAQMHFPGEVRTGTRLAGIGRSSVRFAQALFQADTCTATGESVLVMVDRDSHRPVPVPDAMRDGLAAAGG